MKCLFLALALVVASPDAGRAQTDSARVDLLREVAVPMRDGTILNATIYLPRPRPEPVPTIFWMTPYIADQSHTRAMHFARNGYAFALVDVRGRGSSPGEFEPMVPDGRDGYDITEWLATQPWSNGKISMWGGSYGGFVQWTTAKEFPPHLASIAPAASAHPGVDFPFRDNVMSGYLLRWLILTNGKTGNTNLFGDDSLWDPAFADFHRAGRPFHELDLLTGKPLPVFQRWLEHPTPDAYWDATIPDSAAYAQLSIPILTITGHYDGDQLGALAYYEDHVRWGKPDAVANHYLIIGPWDHAGTRTPRKSIGGLTFSDASLVDLDRLHVEWYDWTLKGGTRPIFLRDRVAYYVMGPGAEQWKYAPDLHSATREHRTLHLGTDLNPDALFRSGRLAAKPVSAGTQPASRFRNDPLRPLSPPSEVPYLVDQSAATALDGDGLVYHTEPFETAVELTGRPVFEAWIAMDVRDTDLQVGLYEIRPDGTSVFLTEQTMRARYRDSRRQEALVKPGEIIRYRFDRFDFFSRRVAQGSRIRLLIRSPSGASIQRNFNGGGVVSDETAKDARTATIELHHSTRYPSTLSLPIGR